MHHVNYRNDCNHVVGFKEVLHQTAVAYGVSVFRRH